MTLWKVHPWMHRATRLLAGAAALSVLMLGGLVLLQRADERTDAEHTARLRRQMALADYLVESQRDRLLEQARRLARNPRLVVAVAGRQGPAADRLLREAELDPQAAVWVGDAHGRRLSGSGEPPPVTPGWEHLVSAALSGQVVQGLLPGPDGFTIEAAAPIGGGGGRPPSGLVRLARPLDDHLVKEIEQLTGGRLHLAPSTPLLTRPELEALSPGGPAGGAVVARADHLARTQFARTTNHQMVFEQLRDSDGGPAGLMALSLPRDGSHGQHRLLLGLWLAIACCLVATVHRSLTLFSDQRAAAAEPPPLPGGVTWVGRSPEVRFAHSLRHVSEHLNHHLNNRLAVVVGNLELVKDEAATEGQSGLLSDVLDQAWSASALLRRLLKACARDGLTRRASVELGAVWADVAQRARRQGLPLRQVRVEGLDGQCVSGLYGDLVEVVWALYENAVAATGEGGRITVTARRHHAHISLLLADNGCGMDPEVIERAADLFFTTRGPLSVGLGLALVDGVIERHGGAWCITSVPGSGTTVKVDLPVWRPKLSEVG